MRLISILIISVFSSALSAQTFFAKDFSAVQNLLNTRSDTVYVINFWATWCKPCIQELPYFEEVSQNNSDARLRVILISLDTEKYWDDALTPFLNKTGLQTEVWALYNAKPENWIDAVSPDWTGAIPATLFLYQGEKYFFGKEFTLPELEQQINTFIKL